MITSALALLVPVACAVLIVVVLVLDASSTLTKTQEGSDMIRSVDSQCRYLLSWLAGPLCAQEPAKKPPYEFVSDFSLAASQGNQEVTTVSLRPALQLCVPDMEVFADGVRAAWHCQRREECRAVSGRRARRLQPDEEADRRI